MFPVFHSLLINFPTDFTTKEKGIIEPSNDAWLLVL